MNKKVLKTMIALVVIFLVGLYILKIFFPQEFILAIENEQLIEIGNYIDSHKWAYYTFGIISSFITYWLYCCATSHKWKLKFLEVIYILATIGINIGLNFVNPNFSTIFSYVSFIILPCIMKSDLKTVTMCYSIHLISQTLTVSIRNLPMYMKNINSLTLYIVGIESYLWLFLLYILYNYKKEV